MSGLNIGRVGIAGEVRCVIKREDGSVREDTGFQKNLILDQGLDFFGGGKGADIFNRCVIGSGNTAPVATQTQLDSFLAITSGVISSVKYDYAPDATNLYKTHKIHKYTFTSLSNVNVSEVGLVSQGTGSTDYYLCTRALLKDASGSPTTITILSGETLEVYYKLLAVYSAIDTNYMVNMLDGKGASVAHNTKIRGGYFGDADYVGKMLGNPLSVLEANATTRVSERDLEPVTTVPSSNITANTGTATLSNYVAGSCKTVITHTYSPTAANGSIRSIIIGTSMGYYQVRFGSVAGDSPIMKTSLQTLSTPFEVSWGRYEGAL